MKSKQLDVNSIRHAKEIFEIFLDNFENDTPMQYGKVFFTLAEQAAAGKEPEVLELQKLTGISTAALSRALGQLGEWSARNKPGAGLIVQTIDPQDRRRRKNSLSLKGIKLLKQVADSFRKEAK